MEAGVAESLDRDGRGACRRLIVACNMPPRRRRFAGSNRSSGRSAANGSTPAVGMLDAAFDLVSSSPNAWRCGAGVEAVVRAVGPLEQHRAPRERNDDAGRDAPPAAPRRRSAGTPTSWRTPHEWSRVENHVSGGTRCARRRPRPSPTPARSGGSAACRRRAGSRAASAGIASSRAPAGTAPSKIHSNATGTHVVGLEREPDPPERLEHFVVDRPDADAVGVVARAAGCRAPSTARCPRDTPAYASITLRFGYLPSPNATCERAVAGRGHRADLLGPGPVGLGDTWRGVSTIWWLNDSSAATSGPSSNAVTHPIL